MIDPGFAVLQDWHMVGNTRELSWDFTEGQQWDVAKVTQS